MAATTQHIVRPGYEHEAVRDPDFPHAPIDWSRIEAIAQARKEGLALTDGHWQVVRALQDYYARHAEVAPRNARQIHDALDERFHALGGIRHLYELFPGGPVAQGCRIAGLPAPAGASDRGFGSVV
ncbi:MAG: TusE/DsrC/DsvC family sulfur relay protein [Thiobacillaceae bacterium]|jgi:tRNA 2-thiouridine synthesizing protein E|nr:TusE/DsrC/DsvC family sulfur relay protein [Thiobacillaceae bacterium]